MSAATAGVRLPCNWRRRMGTSTDVVAATTDTTGTWAPMR